VLCVGFFCLKIWEQDVFWLIQSISSKNAIWIKSSCEPFCDEMELDEERNKLNISLVGDGKRNFLG